MKHFLFDRDELKRHYNLGEYYLTVDVEDVASFDETLAEKLYKLPTDHLPLVRIKNVIEQLSRFTLVVVSLL